MAQPDFYQDKIKADVVLRELEKLTAQLQKDYDLWDELEAKREGL